VPLAARPSIHLPAPGTRRGVVIGAGSFGTAVSVVLARGGLRTTLQTRTEQQASALRERRENRDYLSEVELPRELRIESADAGIARADYVFLAVPATGLRTVIESLEHRGLTSRAAVISLAKGLVGPDGDPPTALLTRLFGAGRTACVGGPAHAREMVSAGAGLVAASTSEPLATAVAGVFIRAGVVCEQSDDPTGVELAGIADEYGAVEPVGDEQQQVGAHLVGLVHDGPCPAPVPDGCPLGRGPEDHVRCRQVIDAGRD